MILLAALPSNPTTGEILWRMAVCGFGFGFFQAPNLRAIMMSAPASRSGGAGGMSALSRLFGQTSGAALVAGCFAVAGAHGPLIAIALGGAFASVASLRASFALRCVPSRRRWT